MTTPKPQPLQNRASILVFSHDLHDARFHKRMRMFSDLGVSVRWLAFDRERKTDLVNKFLQQFPGHALGKSQDAQYGKRAVALASALGKLLRGRFLPGDLDIIYCINLDNLLVAILARTLRRMKCRIVYEVADIQPVLLRQDKTGRALRALERWCLKRTDLVVYTSEHFMSQFLREEQHCQAPSLLLENKIYPAAGLARRAPVRQETPRLVIGFFGQLRCRRSLEMMRRLAASFPDRLQFDLRGYPNHEVREVFEAVIADSPNVTYGGPYRNPDDLARLYASVDLCWGFDLCSPGLNSKWCLTNRLYEAGYFGVPILVEDNTAGGEYVRRLGSGWVFPHPLEESLEAFFSQVSDAEIRARQAHTAQLDASVFALDADLAALRETFLQLAS
jgi:succinoglycan biosynthesis protein ExoL